MVLCAVYFIAVSAGKRKVIVSGMYYDYATAAPLMVPQNPPGDMDVRILGMGTGTYATQCRKYFGDMQVEGVKIDDKITDLSRK